MNWLWRFTLHLATEKRTQPSATGPAFFPELSDPRSPEKDRIQLVHALTMSMGLEWVEATPSTGDNNDEVRMHMAPDPCRYVLSLPATAPAGQGFFYNTGALTLVSAVMRKATGRPLDEFARENLYTEASPLVVAVSQGQLTFCNRRNAKPPPITALAYRQCRA